MATSTDEQSERLPIRRGATSGVGAWLVGYAVFYTLTAAAVRDSTLA